MKKSLTGIFFVMFSSAVYSQTYDSSTLVDTNNNSTSTSTVTSNNTNTNTNLNTNNTTVNSTATNTNINTSTSDNTNRNINTSTSTNTNVNTSTSDNTNRNINTSTSTSTNTNINNSTSESTNYNFNNSTSTSENTNRNFNESTSTQTIDSTNNNNNNNFNKSEITQEIKQPPPTAVAPAMMSGGNSDLCTTGVSGAVQTQIFGLSFGSTVTDKNCERLKLSKTLFDMGMKVAAVATMCQDRRVFDAMWNAGTPCPYEGKIGEAARVAWLENPDRIPRADTPTAETVR